MTLWSTVSAKKRELDALRGAVPADHLDALERHQRVDITYTSNALEGNTLTAGETALVLEKGITVSGKPLKDHLEAIDHARAYDWVLEIARQGARGLSEADLRTLHGLVVANSAPEIAGRYADRARFVNTDAGLREFPAPMEVPGLMRDFCTWIRAVEPGPASAFQAHLRLVAIHPFNDGNGRTARLLMNLLLVRDSYPPIAIRPDDRPAYLSALEQAQGGGGQEAFDALMLRRLDQTLELYIGAAQQAAPFSEKIVPLRK